MCAGWPLCRTEISRRLGEWSKKNVPYLIPLVSESKGKATVRTEVLEGCCPVPCPPCQAWNVWRGQTWMKYLYIDEPPVWKSAKNTGCNKINYRRIGGVSTRMEKRSLLLSKASGEVIKVEKNWQCLMWNSSVPNIKAVNNLLFRGSG